MTRWCGIDWAARKSCRLTCDQDSKRRLGQAGIARQHRQAWRIEMLGFQCYDALPRIGKLGVYHKYQCGAWRDPGIQCRNATNEGQRPCDGMASPEDKTRAGCTREDEGKGRERGPCDPTPTVLGNCAEFPSHSQATSFPVLPMSRDNPRMQKPSEYFN
jgi:hypothetical protein